MNYWIFVVTSHKEYGLTAEQILSQRLQDGFWGLGEKTPNRRTLDDGDKVLFYVGSGTAEFCATAILKSPSFKLTPQQQQTYWHEKEFYRANYGVLLHSIEVWEHRRSARELVPALTFIENKEFWGTYLQGGVRQIPEVDFQTIVSGVVRQPLSRDIPESTEQQSEFALESHLEEFLDQNWPSIDFGSNLERYTSEEENGRQFPAGPWSIDFLCRDKNTGDLVVIELKRGRTSDAAVGQVLRYMGWVSENLAQTGQTVRGIIIAKDADDALIYATRALQSVSVLSYRVQFKLAPVTRSASASVR